jgi:hypothetical protein
MNWNEELADLYSKANILDLLDNYNKRNIDNDWTWPLLIKSYEEYETAEIKVMVFGKDTNGWGPYPEEIGENGVDINCLMNVYERFFERGNCKYNSQFFPIIQELIKMFQEKLNGKSVHYLWNNIVKIGMGGKGFPDKMYYGLIKDNINKIIPIEIDILKPDYIIFFTGPNTYQSGPYDDVINDVFNNPKRKYILDFNERELCEIILPNVKKSFRLYHPKYLYFRKKRDDIDYIQSFNKITLEILNSI